ncbi:MAG: Zn-dependent hydrolase [Chloroflexi bacterium]|nr:Zn-dependent hydrolase [Chloroflexota bacterium]
MDSNWKNLRINEQRFKSDFDELCQIGKFGATGVSRPALSDAHSEARRWFHRKAREAGLITHIDGAGNHSARLECNRKGAKSLLMGSHLDSVPNGGRYDGALGVLAALEVLRSLKENNIPLAVNLEAIDFTDEEGILVSFLGSFAFSGKLTTEDLTNPRGNRLELENRLKQAGMSAEGILAARCDPGTLAGYLELHVEQGPLLEAQGVDIGIVSNISGISFYRLTYIGKAGHAGTISMQDRRDASQGSSAFTLAARQIVLEQFPECFSNVGVARYEPGLFNVIPEKAEIALEFRSAYMDQFTKLKSALLQRAEEEAARFNLGLNIEFLGQRIPVELDETMRHAILEASESLGLRSAPIISRAGHDAQAMADVCPTGMIFIPSVAGISHSPDELTHWQDCVNGANVLLQTALRIAISFS